MGDVKLTAPRVRVVREGYDDLEVQTANPDMVLWDRTRNRQRPAWPSMEAAPFLWLTFVSWAAARRTGAIPADLTYNTWESDVLDVSAINDDEDETGDPTGAGPGPG